MGPLIISAVLHFTETIDLNAPIIIFIFAQLITGSFFGSNMNGLSWKTAKNYVGHAAVIVVSSYSNDIKRWLPTSKDEFLLRTYSLSLLLPLVLVLRAITRRRRCQPGTC